MNKKKPYSNKGLENPSGFFNVIWSCFYNKFIDWFLSNCESPYKSMPLTQNYQVQILHYS